MGKSLSESLFRYLKRQLPVPSETKFTVEYNTMSQIRRQVQWKLYVISWTFSMTSCFTTQPRQHIAKYDGNNYVARANTSGSLSMAATWLCLVHVIILP